jgi:hypothetical protein
VRVNKGKVKKIGGEGELNEDRCFEYLGTESSSSSMVCLRYMKARSYSKFKHLWTLFVKSDDIH